MTQRSNDARNSPLFSDERLRNVLRRQIDRVINVERSRTRQQLADDSGVNIYAIDAIMSADAAKKRRVAIEDAFSLAYTIGERAVNALLMEIGYGGAAPLSDPAEPDYSHLVADGLRHFTVIATALADQRVDHVERPGTTEAADHLIATVLPLSSVGSVK
jgi:hypothetical protein